MDSPQKDSTPQNSSKPLVQDVTNTSSHATEKQEDLETLVDQIGGHGRFQVFLWSVGFGSKACVAGVFLFMSFAGATPDFWCKALPTTSGGGTGNGSDVIWRNPEAEVENGYGGLLMELTEQSPLYKACEVNGTTCEAFVFADDRNTIVNTWSLVCDKKWMSTTITSLQMVGVLLGALTAGQMGDIWGRKKTSMLMIFGQMVFSLANAFSPNWIFFLVTRIGAGFSGGGYLVPYLALTMEFTDIRWRAVLGAIPAWPIGAGLMALTAWLVHDWQYLGIAIGLFCLPFLVAWWFMPESIRWLVVHNRVEEAQAVLERAATWNGTQAPDLAVTRRVAEAEMAKAKQQSVYTFKDLFHTRDMVKTTCLLLFIWFSSGAVYYFLAFGAETLYGNLYFNIFLLSMVEAPAQGLSAYMNNKIGRRWTAFITYCGAGMCAIVVIILIQTDADGSAVNAMIITSKLAMGGGWAAVIVYSAEIFPTVVRNVGYGACNMASRVGAIVAPQMVFLYDTHPYVPYAVVAFLMMGSAVCFFKIRETNDQALEDVLPTSISDNSSSSSTQNHEMSSVPPEGEQDGSPPIDNCTP